MPLTAIELESFARSTGELMKQMLDPFHKRLDHLQDQLDSLPKPKDGKDGAPGKDGRDAEVHASLVSRVVTDYLEAHPIQVPKDGRDGREGKDGKDGRDGKDGKDAVLSVQEDVIRAVDEWLREHKPADGKDGRDGVDGVDGKDGARGADGIDGKDGADGVIGKDGRDGVNGSAGKDGAPGKDADVQDLMPIVEGLMNKAAAELERRVRDWLDKAVAALPKAVNGKDGHDGSDGKDGRDGRDGFSLDDFGVTVEGRTMLLSFTNGKTKIEHPIKLMGIQYREIWQPAVPYEIGDFVTWDGSMWAALKENVDSKPGEYNRNWRLAVKRGRNGKSS